MKWGIELVERGVVSSLFFDFEETAEERQNS